MRIVNQTFDEKGLVNVIDKTTTLMSVEDAGVTLEHDAVHEVGGTRFPRDPEVEKVGFHDVLLSQDPKVKEVGKAEVVVEGRKIECSVLQVDVSGPASKTMTKIYYSANVPPYVLKRESVTSDPAGNNSRTETTIEVMALDMPCKVGAQIQTAAYVRTVMKHARGMRITWAATSKEIPGGVIWHASKDLDETGRVIRRSTLQLVDYGEELEPERTGLFLRRRRGLIRRGLPRLQPP